MFEELKARLAQEEGNVACMYLDVLGLVTCGVGHLLNSPNDALKLPWLVGNDATLFAGVDQITKEFQAVKALKPAMGVKYYMDNTTLRLSLQARDALLNSDLTSFQTGLDWEFPGFVHYFPIPVQEALLDMAFQLGVRGLVTKFPTLSKAVRRRDWLTCAKECHRQEIVESRNVITHNLFLDGVKAS